MARAQPGLAIQALLSDPKDPKSLVNRLSDSRWKAAAEALQLGTKGIDALRDPKIQATLNEGLQRARWQDDLEAKQTGLGDAVVFQERASAVDGNVYAVLGDPILRRVITGALGLPESIAVQPVETQARAVESRLKLDKLDNREGGAAPRRALPRQCRDERGGDSAPRRPGAAGLVGLLQRLRPRCGPSPRGSSIGRRERDRDGLMPVYENGAVRIHYEEAGREYPCSCCRAVA
jgi:hypothetical protein